MEFPHVHIYTFDSGCGFDVDVLFMMDDNVDACVEHPHMKCGVYVDLMWMF